MVLIVLARTFCTTFSSRYFPRRLPPPPEVAFAWLVPAPHPQIYSRQKPEGMNIDHDDRPKDKGVQPDYGQSTVGNLFLAREFARETPQNKIVHACLKPGNLSTGLQRHWSGLGSTLTLSMMP